MYNMKLPTVQPWSSWTYNQQVRIDVMFIHTQIAFRYQVGGYLVKFKGMSLVTAHGAGHMVTMLFNSSHQLKPIILPCLILILGACLQARAWL